jgi:oligosaccharide repeat unit polymerase
MSWVSIACFLLAGGIILSTLYRGTDILSPGRIFGFVWLVSIGLADLKLSGFQHDWSTVSWILLLVPIVAFLTGTFAVYVLHLESPMMPIAAMRERLKREKVQESRLFWLICVSVGVYITAYTINYMVKGWLPIEAAERGVSRVEFNITGLSFLTYLVPAILFFIVLYFVKVRGNIARKAFLAVLLLFVVGSFLLFISRFQIIIVFVLCFTYFYYGTHRIKVSTALVMFLAATGFFYWISSIRLSHLVAAFLYWTSKMKFSPDYAFLTEPYMYLVMNLENFARAVNQLDYHTYGYFSFDFVTAIAGLKYWAYEYFNLDRTPFLISGYNTYTSFWPLYLDFGVVGLSLFPLMLGFGTSLLYRRLRTRPSTKNVTAYGILVFVMLMSFFVPALSFLWFQFNLLVLFLILKWTIIPATSAARASEGGW